MILLTLLACLPSTFTVEADVYDLDRACIYRDVNVTFDTKYWGEWYRDKGDCGDYDGVFATNDGFCISYVGCTDRAPLIEDDPLFDFSDEATRACSDLYHDDDKPDCGHPALLDWP
jgi:hypothetical protein